MNCRVLELTEELIRRESVTPEDAGCLTVIGTRLERLGFTLEAYRPTKRIQPLGDLW